MANLGLNPPFSDTSVSCCLLICYRLLHIHIFHHIPSYLSHHIHIRYPLYIIISPLYLVLSCYHPTVWISAADVIPATGGCTRRRAAPDGKGSDDDRGQTAGGNRALRCCGRAGNCWDRGWDSIWNFAFLFWKHSNVGVHRPLKFGDIKSNLRFRGLELFIAPYMIWFMVWWILFLVDPDARIDGL